MSKDLASRDQVPTGLGRRRFINTAALAGVALLAGPASGQTYPSKPVRIVISFPPGGSTDFLARFLAERLQLGLQQSVIVDYRPGGNSIIAAEAVAKAPPDGHTLFMALDATMSLNPLLYSKLPYVPERDFAPISHVASQAVFLVASPKAPVRTLPDLLAYAKANPGKLTYGTSALLLMLTGEKMKLDFGVQMLHIPFKGGPDMQMALLAGAIDFSITGVIPYATWVKEGKLFGLATTGPARERLLPNTPTVRELGYAELDFGLWNGLFAPAGTPAAILERLNAEVHKALGDPAANERLIAVGHYPSASTPEHLRILMRTDVQRWSRVIKEAGIKLDGS